jgi:hypothetical protein
MRVGVGVIAVLGFALAATTMSPGPAQASTDVQRLHTATAPGNTTRTNVSASPPYGWYTKELIDYGSRKCMDTENHQPYAGTKIVQWDCYNSSDQLWQVNPDGNYHAIGAAVNDPDTGQPQCLALAGGNAIIGWQLELYNCVFSDDQLWKFTPHGSSWVIWNKKAPNLVIAISGGRTDNGAPVELYYWQAHPDQSWIIPDVTG